MLFAACVLAALAAPAAATGGQAKPAKRANPLMKPSTLPFQAPEFDKIKDSDFQPAFEAGIREQRAEILKIADNPAPPTFENTIVALERSGQLLSRVSMIFNGLVGANADAVLEKVQEVEAPKLSAVRDEMLLNGKLFQRVETIYDARATLKLGAEGTRLVEYYHQQFVRAGARLSAADKAQLKKLNEEDATLSAQFMSRLLAGTKAGALVVSDKAKLAGLSPAQIDAAAQAAKARGLTGKWVIPLQNTTQQPDLAELTDRATRQALFEASWNRTERGDANDTRKIIARLAQLRAEQAKLLGYPDYAAWKLTDQMAKTPEAVNHFMDQLVGPATARARAEAAELQKLIDEQHGGFTLEPWDWEFYAEQVRKAKYSIDENQIKPYFLLSRVLTDGVFYAAHQLYGLTFKERHDLPVYEKTVRVFEVFDKTGAPLGLFYADYFKRDNKSGGAWMDNFVVQSKLLGTKPVIYNVANFAPPAPGQPALITSDDVVTM
ncbi:MAG: dipeptidyl carboxypeptidase II, partial [Acidobacteriota bacterium]|nr:dipeptidyl carboxypeptidase II [Acidobacteriota bacterium]